MATTPDDDKVSFVMEHVGRSANYRRQYEERWLETIENVTMASSGTTWRRGPISLDQIFLKDSATHRALMSYSAKIVRSILGDQHGEYVHARPVGWEDAKGAAPTASRLLRYAFRLPGHYRTMQEAVAEDLMFGCGIVEVGYRYQQRMMPVRSASVEEGVEMPGEITNQKVTVYDDVDLTVVDVQDFYPDPGTYRIERMKGAAVRFRQCLAEAEYFAKTGFYMKSGVSRLGDQGHRSGGYRRADSFREGIDQPLDAERLSEFGEMVGYRYLGEVPWEDEYDGGGWREVRVLDGVLVKDDGWPYTDAALPWKTLVVNPTVGRFWCTAPAEVLRYDQEFADTLKELIARAVIRQVHAPIIFEPDSEVDTAMLRRWRLDDPIPARGGPAAAGTLQYNVNIAGAIQMLTYLTNDMANASGMRESIQGGEGPDREAASVGVMRYQSASDPLESTVLLLERDAFPEIGRSIIKRYQQFLRSTEDLARRIGQLPEGLWIGDMLADFDVEYIGSRMDSTRAQKLQALQTLGALAAAIPGFQAMLPSAGIAQKIVGDILELPDIAAQVGDPAVMEENLRIAQLMGGGAQSGNGNGVPTSPAAPPGIMPAQAQGGEIGPS